MKTEIAEADVAELKQLFDSVEAKQYKSPDMNGDLRLGFASDDFAGTKWKNLTGATRWSDGTEMVTLDYSRLTSVLWGVVAAPEAVSVPVDTSPTVVKFPALAVLLMVSVLPVIPVAELSRPTLAAPVMLNELPDTACGCERSAGDCSRGVHARRENVRAVHVVAQQLVAAHVALRGEPVQRGAREGQRARQQVRY